MIHIDLFFIAVIFTILSPEQIQDISVYLDLSPSRSCTGWLSTGGGTRGIYLVHHLPAKLRLEATSTLPPEVRPHILPFGNQGLGTSSSSPPGSSSSARRKILLDKSTIIPNKLAVKKLIEKIELESEKNYKKKENKKKENPKELMKKTEIKKKEDCIDLEVETKMTNLQGLGP
jgi:hypothetical protein